MSLKKLKLSEAKNHKDQQKLFYKREVFSYEGKGLFFYKILKNQKMRKHEKIRENKR